MIKRIFCVDVFPELKGEFEEKFQNVALKDIASTKGCLAVDIFKPTAGSPHTYCMISDWESDQALEDKFGANWQVAYIPEIMKKYERSHTVQHCEWW